MAVCVWGTVSSILDSAFLLRGVRSPESHVPSSHRLRCRLRWFTWLLGLCTLSGCATPPPPNILIVLIDALRADRVGWYGDTRGLTPFLDSLAERGHVFHQAYAASSWTSPSVASLFTSRFPSQTGVVALDSILSDSEQTLAEALQARGYATGGFVANILVNGGWGYGQGFDEYKIVVGAEWVKEPAARVDAAALAWLDSLVAPAKQRRPVFMYLHYMEAHQPLTPARGTLDWLMERRHRPDDVRDAAHTRLADPKLKATADAEGMLVMQDLYDAAVMDLDAELRTFFAELERRGFLDNALAVITADHGEEFMDHGRFGHGVSLYNELIRVPLLVLAPHQTRRADVEDVVSLVDIAPSAIELAGGVVPASFEGHSLRSALRPFGRVMRLVTKPVRILRGSDPTGGSAWSELLQIPLGTAKPPPHTRALVAGSQKLLSGPNDTAEAYDLRSDPHETHSSALTPENQQQIVQRTEQFAGHLAQRAMQKRTGAIDDETRERMRALGY